MFGINYLSISLYGVFVVCVCAHSYGWVLKVNLEINGGASRQDPQSARDWTDLVLLLLLSCATGGLRIANLCSGFCVLNTSVLCKRTGSEGSCCYNIEQEIFTWTNSWSCQ